MGQKLKAYKTMVNTRYNQLLELARIRPLILIALFPAYIALSVLMGTVAIGIAVGTCYVFPPEDILLPEHLFFVLLILFLLLIWGHYIYLNLTAFLTNIRIERDASPVIRIAQMLLTTVFAFAIVYYYLQLFTGDKAFEGMSLIGYKKRSYGLEGFMDKLLFIPPFETIVDCFYYSVVTISTVGYGDIHPKYWLAKLLTSSEVIAGFVLIVLSLGSVIGAKKHELLKSKPNTRMQRRPRSRLDMK